MIIKKALRFSAGGIAFIRAKEGVGRMIKKVYHRAKQKVSGNGTRKKRNAWTSLGHTRELTHAYPHISMIA